MKKMQGVYTAIVTPFQKDNELSQQILRQIIKFQIENEVNGIVPLGTTGEAPTLSFQEREKILQISVEEAKGKCLIIAGTGSYSTEQTIENTRQAKNLGVDAVLVVTPYYNKPSQEGLYRHYMSIADSVDIPIVVYNIQGRTGVNIQTETLKRMAHHPNIIAVKEASGNLTQVSDVIEQIGLFRSDFSVLSGDDGSILPIIALGGTGVISVLSNLIPDQIVSLIRALLAFDYSSAREIHYRLMPLVRAAFIETNPVPIKAMMNLLEMNVGECRLPLCELNSVNLKKVKESIEFLTASLSCYIRDKNG